MDHTRSRSPPTWLTWGADLRVRDEYYDNIVSLSDASPLSEQNVIRFRGRFWTSVMPVTNVSVNARLSAEPRLWTKPARSPAAYRNQAGHGMALRHRRQPEPEVEQHRRPTAHHHRRPPGHPDRRLLELVAAWPTARRATARGPSSSTALA